MLIRFDKELYPKAALIKAAYQFTDRAYVYLNQDNKDFIVSIEAKKELDDVVTENEFKNELLAQAARFVVYQQTKNIRELIMGRALASTLILSENSNKPDDSIAVNDNLDEILTDWFDKYETTTS